MMIFRVLKGMIGASLNRRNGVKVGLLSVCERVTFGKNNRVHKMVRLKNVALGDFTYVANGARVQNATVGKYCSIGPNCRIGLGTHPTRVFVSTHPAFYSTHHQASVSFVDDDLFADYAQIVIGNDVWIGEGAIVLDGVEIGDGAVVGAGAVVTRNVPPYGVVVGVPAKLIRYRFPPADIEFLQSSKWWDRDFDWLRKNADSFRQVDALKTLLRNELRR